MQQRHSPVSEHDFNLLSLHLIFTNLILIWNFNREGMLFGMGNPLLDMIVHVDEAFLQKYKLEPNNAILADETHVPMYDELLQKYAVEFVAGGACQNVLRTVQVSFTEDIDSERGMKTSQR